ncbi:MAG TPA: hypothetical protein VEH48_02225 [Candidatus Nitrosopolaris sp.]|nr:hypothetical protein [Candidatus Nitrosopolaris sp.]
MELLNKTEQWLANLYRGAPKLSSGSKKSIVGIWPIVALIFGVLQLLAVIELWHLGHEVTRVANLVNSFGAYYATNVAVHLNVFYWLSMIVVAADGIILLAAYPALRRQQKSGWNLLFYASLLNLVYGVFSAFNNYGGVASLILQVIVSAIVLYFLFQIRDQYSSVKAPR